MRVFHCGYGLHFYCGFYGSLRGQPAPKRCRGGCQSKGGHDSIYNLRASGDAKKLPPTLKVGNDLRWRQSIVN